MIVVYMAVRKVEKEAFRYSFSRFSLSSRQTYMDMSHSLMVQGILYSAALASLCISFILVVILSVLDSSYAVQVLGSILLPLQGFWNALTYSKPQIEQIIKKIYKSQQNVCSLIQQCYQNTSEKASWMTRFRMIFIRKRTSKESRVCNSNQQVEVQDESKKEEDIEQGGNEDRVGVLKVNTIKQEEQMSHVNPPSSELKDRKSIMIKEIKGDNNSNALILSSLMLSCDEQEEANEELLSFALTQNSELKNEEQSQMENFSALEANVEGCDNIGNEDNDDSDNESYVDDYLRMMKLG